MRGQTLTLSQDHWNASTACPQCGGEVPVAAGDPVFACSFCRTRLYMVANGPLRYTLPARHLPEGPRQRLVHIPFWRFKGLRYTALAARRIEGGLLDATTPAVSALDPAITLGIQPQVARLTLAHPGPGLMPPDRTARESLLLMSKRLPAYRAEEALFERLVGESQCLIYAPMLLETNGAKDPWRLTEAWGTQRRHCIDAGRGEILLAAESGPCREEKIRFLPLLCPECGQDLPGRHGAVALLCQHCMKAWWIRQGIFAPLPYIALSTPQSGGQAAFLPFWHLVIGLPGFPLRSRGAFRRAAVPYQKMPEGWDQQAMQLMLPAFKLNPNLYLRVACRTSLAPIEIPPLHEEPRPATVMATGPVLLTLQEAAQAVRIVLFELLRRQRPLFPLVRSARLRVKSFRLVYLPFRPAGKDWQAVHAGQAVPANALALGQDL